MLRELDQRTGNHLRVTLYWQDDDNTLVVGVEDFKEPGRENALTVIPPADERLAFEHPFGYQPNKVQHKTGNPRVRELTVQPQHIYNGCAVPCHDGTAHCTLVGHGASLRAVSRAYAATSHGPVNRCASNA